VGPEPVKFVETNSMWEQWEGNRARKTNWRLLSLQVGSGRRRRSNSFRERHDSWNQGCPASEYVSVADLPTDQRERSAWVRSWGGKSSKLNYLNEWAKIHVWWPFFPPFSGSTLISTRCFRWPWRRPTNGPRNWCVRTESTYWTWTTTWLR
jgi:hypothetical protein